ncbi:uracil-DNA glycosylase [Halalkalicoccus ordinarius]|uniref:uracil-DNA glycosylase n=1 Tax=Halalkalicoccus ordinarius TaxID=3116651 RepID=UPI00300F5228
MCPEFETELAAVPEERFDRSQFVPSVDPLDADVMPVGEAPGADEVERLERVLEEVGIGRREIYITNLVKVRPPENRDPYRDEIEAWCGVLDAEIDRVDPDVIVPMGSFAARELLDTDETITDLRGESRTVRNREAIPTFHPAAALYDRSKVDTLEEDFAAILSRPQ